MRNGSFIEKSAVTVITTWNISLHRSSALAECCPKVGPASVTLGQPWMNTRPLTVSHGEWMELPFLLLLWGLSDPRIAELREMPQSFSIKLHSDTQVSGRLGMSGSRSPGHAQNPLSGERKKTLSITHYALSLPRSHHHLYIIYLINWLQRFYCITMSLKRPFVSQSDVKQRFTTTALDLSISFEPGLFVQLFHGCPSGCLRHSGNVAMWHCPEVLCPRDLPQVCVCGDWGGGYSVRAHRRLGAKGICSIL